MAYQEHGDILNLSKADLGDKMRRCQIAYYSAKEDGDVESCEYYNERLEILRQVMLTQPNRGSSKTFSVVQMNDMRYAQYLRTDHWQNMRLSIIARDGSICRRCNTITRTPQVHHLTYERRGRELPEDLITVCDDCHNAIHGVD